MELIDTIKQYVSGKQYASSNIRTSDGTLAYMTNTGIAKAYPSMEVYDATVGKNNCKAGFVQLSPNWNDLGFPVGSLMKSGQSCGNENTYVQSTPPDNNFDWKFYIQNNSDVRSAGIISESAALQHWNTIGQQEGRLPNATIMTSMGTLGKVGYIDVDTTMHEVTPTYDGTYIPYRNKSNVTGIKMRDCTRPQPTVNYGEILTMTFGSQSVFMNASSILEVGSSNTNFILQPVVGSSMQGKPVQYGDKVSITTSSSNYTSDCGWWGCKVGRVNPDTLLFEFGPGGDNVATFRITPPRGSNYEIGSTLKHGDTFNFEADIVENKSILEQEAFLSPGESLTSMNRQYVLVYQTDGNVCIYKTGGGGLYCSMALHSPGKLVMQGDGNLVAYDSGGVPRWATNTAFSEIGQGVAPYTFALKDDGSAQVVDSTNTILWSTETRVDTNESYLNTYSELIGYDSAGYDIPGAAYGNATVDSCKNTCNKNSECAGFAYLNDNNTCFPKYSSMYPNGAKQKRTDININLYIRDKQGPSSSIQAIAYVKGSTVQFGPWTEGKNANTFAFTSQTDTPATCDLEELKKECNESQCTGFIHSAATNSWQMITPSSTASDYTITSNLQDFYLKKSTVDMNSTELMLDYRIENQDSYKPSGTSLYDLTSNSNATLVNNPSYSADGGPNNTGYVTLDATKSQYILTNTSLHFSGTSISVFLWVYPTGDGVLLTELGQSAINESWHDSQIEMVNGVMKFSVWPYSVVLEASTPLNEWYYVGFVYNQQDTKLSAYVNGNEVASGTMNRQAPNNLFYAIGGKDTTNMGNGGYGNFRFAGMQVYNSALTSTQAQQKFSAYNCNGPKLSSGVPQFIDPTLFANYDQGEPYDCGCNSISITPPTIPKKYKQEQENMMKKGKEVIDKYKALSVSNVQQQNVEATKDMKTKTDEYQNVLNNIKKLRPSITLEQQQTDMTLFDEQNQIRAIMWGIAATLILAMILFRPK